MTAYRTASGNGVIGSRRHYCSVKVDQMGVISSVTTGDQGDTMGIMTDGTRHSLHLNMQAMLGKC